MADPQRFEGPSVEEVLAEVRASLGPDAEILEANKIRSGGIGGFFAKEAFEVVALPAAGAGDELPPAIDPAAFDRAEAHVRGAVAGTPTSLMDLADRINDAEQQAGTGPSAAAPATGAPAPQAAPGDRPRSAAEAVAQQAMREHLRLTAAPQGSEASDPLATPPQGLAEGGTAARRAAQDMAKLVTTATGDDGFHPMAAEQLPRLSTEQPAFTDVLQRIAADAGPDATTEVDARIAAAMAARRQAEAPATAAASSATTMAATPPAGGATASTASAALTPLPDAGASRTPRTRSEESVIEVTTRPMPVARDGDRAHDSDADGLACSDRTARLLSWLERDNLPRTTLMTALRGLPKLPDLPDTTGLVVAVVGERKAALKLCKALAKACDADPADVVLASTTYTGSAMPESQRIIDVTDAARERMSWRRRTRPTFVAVESPSTLRGDVHDWTRGIVDALEAHQVIGVVAAARKVEDVARWVELVGGVDGLALQGLADTSTPYAVLALEIPVAYLDEVVATAGTWAQALLEGAPA